MFVLEDFIANPTVTALSKLTKVQWVSLAAHYRLEYSLGSRKDEIKQLVLQHMLKEEIFSEEEVEMLERPSNLIALRQIELEEKKLEVERMRADNERIRLSRSPTPVECEPDYFKIDKALKFVPKFNEKDPEEFFTHFEKSAGLHAWPQEKWVLLINSSFTGRAQEGLLPRETNCITCIQESARSVSTRVPPLL